MTNATTRLQFLECAYLALLKLPHDSIRLKLQPALCDLRDAIASYRGIDGERAQNEYEEKALRSERVAPFDNCQFRVCDLPGQCIAEGRCHHPIAAPQGKDVPGAGNPSVEAGPADAATNDKQESLPDHHVDELRALLSDAMYGKAQHWSPEFRARIFDGIHRLCDQAMAPRSAERTPIIEEAFIKLQRAYITSIPGGNRDMDAAMVEMAEAVIGKRIATLPSSAEGATDETPETEWWHKLADERKAALDKANDHIDAIYEALDYTKARGEQTGDSPMDLIHDLKRNVRSSEGTPNVDFSYGCKRGLCPSVKECQKAKKCLEFSTDTEGEATTNDPWIQDDTPRTSAILAAYYEKESRQVEDEERDLWEPVRQLESELAEAKRDLETGFMAGSYARLKNLQDAERRLAEKDRRYDELVQHNQELRSATGSSKDAERLDWLEKQKAGISHFTPGTKWNGVVKKAVEVEWEVARRYSFSDGDDLRTAIDTAMAATDSGSGNANDA